MNSLKIAAILLSLIGLLNSARASESASAMRSVGFHQQLVQQFTLSPEEAKLVQNTTVRFYYKLDSSGKVQDVKALCCNAVIRTMLEKHFRELHFSYCPGLVSGRVDVRFRLD